MLIGQTQTKHRLAGIFKKPCKIFTHGKHETAEMAFTWNGTCCVLFSASMIVNAANKDVTIGRFRVLAAGENVTREMV